MDIIVFIIIALAAALMLVRRAKKPTGDVANLSQKEPTGDVAHPTNKIAHAEKQFDALGQADLSARRVFNKSEQKIFTELRSALNTIDADVTVMGQVSMGAMIKTKSVEGMPQYLGRNAYRAINSKRVDFALVDAVGTVRLVVEFDGPSHAARANRARDSVKMEALKRAGIPALILDYREDTDARTARINAALRAL